MYNNYPLKRSVDVSKYFPELSFCDHIASEADELVVVYRATITLNIFYSNTQDFPQSELITDVVILSQYNASCISQLSQCAHMLNVYA